MEEIQSNGKIKPLYAIGARVRIIVRDWKDYIHPFMKAGCSFEGKIVNKKRVIAQRWSGETILYTVKIDKYEDPLGQIPRKQISILLTQPKAGFREEMLSLVIDMEDILNNIEILESKI